MRAIEVLKNAHNNGGPPAGHAVIVRGPIALRYAFQGRANLSQPLCRQ
jgi:hypothetical protein